MMKMKLLNFHCCEVLVLHTVALVVLHTQSVVVYAVSKDLVKVLGLLRVKESRASRMNEREMKES